MTAGMSPPHSADGVNPALPVRASISLPLIFVPLHITDLPSTPLNDKSWEDVGYVGEKPSEVGRAARAGCGAVFFERVVLAGTA